MAGRSTGSEILSRERGATVALELESCGSRVLVFSRASGAGPLARREVAGTLDISTGWSVTFYGVRFQPQDMERLQPLPSGLLGPVRLIAATRAGS